MWGEVVRLLKSVAAVIKRLAAYQLSTVNHFVKTTFIVGFLLTNSINHFSNYLIAGHSGGNINTRFVSAGGCGPL